MFEIARNDVNQMDADVPERERFMRDDEKELFIRCDRRRSESGRATTQSFTIQPLARSRLVAAQYTVGSTSFK